MGGANIISPSQPVVITKFISCNKLVIYDGNICKG